MKRTQLVESLRRVDPTSSAGLLRDNVDGKTAEPGHSGTLTSGAGGVVDAGVDVWMLISGGDAHDFIEVKDCRAPDEAALDRDDAPALPDAAEGRQAVPGLDNVKSDGGMRAWWHRIPYRAPSPASITSLARRWEARSNLRTGCQIMGSGAGGAGSRSRG